VGTDGRYYVLDFSRVFPPESTSSGDRRVFYYKLRPELVRKFNVPLNSDAFTPWCTHNREHDEKEVCTFTLLLFSHSLGSTSYG